MGAQTKPTWSSFLHKHRNFLVPSEGECRTEANSGCSHLDSANAEEEKITSVGDKSNRNKLTIIAGAGASIPFLSVGGEPLSTQLSAKALKDDHLWGDVWGKFNSRRQVRDARGPGRIVDRLELNEVLALRDMLLRALTGTRFCETNFEYLIHLMDKTSYYLQSSSTDQIVQLDALTLAIEDTFRKQFPKTERDGWMYVPFLSREVILETVLHAWNELQGSRKDEVLKLHRKFLENAAKKYDQVRVYSLNYDPLLLEAIQPLSEYSNGFLDSGEFAPHTFATGPGTLALFHGSVAFFCQDGKVRLSAEYSAAQEKRINNIVLGKHIGAFSSKGLHANTNMVTGLDKSDQLVLNPYATYLHHFAIDAFDSSAVCVIGWSFGDNYIKAFLTNLPLERPHQRVVVVNRRTKEDVLEYAKTGDEFLFKLASTTGDTFPYFPTQAFQRLAKDVGKNGFGKFSAHTWFYGKGTEDFYDDAFDSGLL